MPALDESKPVGEPLNFLSRLQYGKRADAAACAALCLHRSRKREGVDMGVALIIWNWSSFGEKQDGLFLFVNLTCLLWYVLDLYCSS